MNEEKEMITLPRELQIDMLKFFMKTSIPRIKKMKEQEQKNKSTIEN